MIVPWKNERIRQISQRPEVKVSIEIILSIFTVTILLFAAVRPTLAIVATLQKKIDDQDTVDKKLTNKLEQLIRSTTDLSTYADSLDLFSQAVTDQAMRAGLVKRIELLAQEGNLEINQYTFDAVPLIGKNINLTDKIKAANKPPLVPGTNIASFVINIDIKGTQDNILDFYRKFEQMDRLVFLNNIELKKEIGKDNQGKDMQVIRSTAKATVYYISL